MRKDLILFGNYLHKDYVFNNILLVLKFCIYKSRVKQEKTSFNYGKNDLNNFYSIEKFMYQTNFKQHSVDIRWHNWKAVFEN